MLVVVSKDKFLVFVRTYSVNGSGVLQLSVSSILETKPKENGLPVPI